MEGRELVENSIERAMNLRVKVANDPLLKKYFDILSSEDLISPEFRKSGFKALLQYPKKRLDRSDYQLAGR